MRDLFNQKGFSKRHNHDVLEKPFDLTVIYPSTRLTFHYP